MTHTPDRMEIEKITPDDLLPHLNGGMVLFAKVDKIIIVKLNEVIDAVNNLHRRLDEYEKE